MLVTIFSLCVSTLHPHKNLARLVRAFMRWRRRQGADTRLVIAGMRGYFAAELEREIANEGAGDVVRLTGWIPDEELLSLYRRARAFAFPSLFEGFGIPVVEAMACGLPCAVSGREPMRSHAGDAVLYFDPCDEEQMAAAIGRVLCDEGLRADLRKRALKQAFPFRWENTARLTLASLEAAGKRR
jgi:glycosyltransferase involved in cell wall biosynthesis